ncbi:MAG: type II secretion system protein GspM [Maricaulaceae bacterium]|jgi:general secretion pathway protein M
MKQWWNGLSGRERALIALAGGVVLALGFAQLVMIPLRKERAQAQAAFLESEQLLAEVRAGAARAPAASPAAVTDDGSSLRATLMATARARGLTISRVQPLDDGGLSLRFDAADPVVLYEWIAAAADDRGVLVRQASLSRVESGGFVQATVVLEGGRA